MRTIAATLLVGASLLLVACGGSGSDSSSSAASNVSVNDVVSALGLVPNPGGISYSALNGSCDVAVVLTSKQEVDLYAGAGDPVAKNQDGTVGLKVGSNDPSMSDADCVDALSAALDHNF